MNKRDVAHIANTLELEVGKIAVGMRFRYQHETVEMSLDTFTSIFKYSNILDDEDSLREFDLLIGQINTAIRQYRETGVLNYFKPLRT